MLTHFVKSLSQIIFAFLDHSHAAVNELKMPSIDCIQSNYAQTRKYEQ